MYSITQLTAENFMRLKAVSIRPEGHIVEITGENGAGKTSVINAIWAALGGREAFPDKPIRKGQEKATITLKLGENGETALKITRKFIAQEDGSFTSPTILIENAEGARFTNSPEKMLKGLVGALSFDPLAFADMKPADQYEALKAFVTGVDLKAIEEQNKADFTRRTDVNRRAKEARTRAEGIDMPAGAPKARIDDSALLDQMTKAGETNTKIAARAERRRQASEEADAKIERAKAIANEVAEMREKIEHLEETEAALREMAKDTREAIAEAGDLPPLVEVADLRRQLDEAAAKNRAFDAAAAARAQEKALIDEAQRHEAESAALTAAMDARDKQKADAIKAAKLPVEGLGFGADEITLDGLPFSQASGAQKLRTSVAIAAAMNPKLRVLRVEEGSLLDKKSFALLGEMAKQMDCQIWIESVDSGRPAAIEIRDGEVAS